VVTVAHARSAVGMGRSGHLAAGPGRCYAWTDFGSCTVHRFSISDILFPIEISRNLFKFLKFIENKIKLRKIQSKFLYNPLEQIFAIGLTKFIFVLYFLIDNSYKSNIGVFNYKNT
jgi:hypothetical protein